MPMIQTNISKIELRLTSNTLHFVNGLVKNTIWGISSFWGGISTATDLWIFLYDYATYLFARHSVEISEFLC